MKTPTNTTATPLVSDVFNHSVSPRRELKTLHLVLAGGPRDTETRDLQTRDITTLGFGWHRRGVHYLDEYSRTTELDVTGRTVFRHRRTCVVAPTGNWATRVMEALGLRTAPAVTIGDC